MRSKLSKNKALLKILKTKSKKKLKLSKETGLKGKRRQNQSLKK